MANTYETKTEVVALLSDIKIWIRKRKLKLNEKKTEIMLIKGNLRTNVIHEFCSLDVEASTLAPVNSAQNLGISFDPELSFKKQIAMVVKNCHFQIHDIYAIRKFLDQKCMLVFVQSPVISKIDYCISLYVSLPNYLLRSCCLLLTLKGFAYIKNFTCGTITCLSHFR